MLAEIRTWHLRKVRLIIPFDIDVQRTGSSRVSSNSYGSWRTRWERDFGTSEVVQGGMAGKMGCRIYKHERRDSRVFEYCLSDPPGRDEAVVREGTLNSVKKGAHLGPLNEGERARETRGAHPALNLPHLLARLEC
jgi:hypothetical protein